MTAASRTAEGRSVRRFSGRVLLYFSLTVVAFIVLLPVLWMISASVRPEGNIVAHPGELIPTVFTFDNYRQIWSAIPFLHELRNTLIFAGSVTVISLFRASGCSSC
jgi:multiple sugar transport system permease protein